MITSPVEDNATNRNPEPVPFLISDRPEIRIDPELIKEWKRNESDNSRWQRKGIVVQFFLLIATIFAFGAAWRYANIADEQENVMSRQWEVLNNQWQTMRHQWTTMDQTLKEVRKQTLFASQSAAAAQSQERLNRQEIVGTKAPKMRFVPYGGGDNGFFNFQVINDAAGSSVTATDVKIDITVMIKSWPSRQTIFTQSSKRLTVNSVPSNSPNALVTYMDERYFVAPNDVWREVMSGNAFAEVDWHGSYNNGFGEIVRVGPKSDCSVHLPELKCAKYSGGFSDSGACSSTQSMIKRLAADRKEKDQQYCQTK
jgi:hypothetical protein